MLLYPHNPKLVTQTNILPYCLHPITHSPNPTFAKAYLDFVV